MQKKNEDFNLPKQWSLEKQDRNLSNHSGFILIFSKNKILNIIFGKNLKKSCSLTL